MADTKNEWRCLMPRKEKYVPVYGQNVLALQPLPGMEYALTWLTAEKLHKYWPMISRFSYGQLVSLNGDNWQSTLESVGVRSHTVTQGAKDRLLRLTRELRDRAAQLKELCKHGKVDNILDYIRRILRTPLADLPEPGGEELIPLIRKTLSAIQNMTRGTQSVRTFLTVKPLTEIFESRVLKVMDK